MATLEPFKRISFIFSDFLIFSHGSPNFIFKGFSGGRAKKGGSEILKKPGFGIFLFFQNPRAKGGKKNTFSTTY